MNVTEAQYQVRVSIANFKDVMAFANRINQMSGCRSLTSGVSDYLTSFLSDSSSYKDW